jgi:hypothetical protein
MSKVNDPHPKRVFRRIARYRAGLILESVLNEGWEPEDLIKKYGPKGAERIKDDLFSVACWLIDTGHPDGEPTGPLAGRKRP